MESFKDIFYQYTRKEIEEQLKSISKKEIEAALYKEESRNLNDFIALISPKAIDYLEDLAKISQAITRQRFGKVIQLFAPIYLSNECKNVCTYCGFSFTNKVARKTLNKSEILEEIKILKRLGFDSILLLTGEDGKNVNIHYFKEVIPIFKRYFSHVSIEVQPLKYEEYISLKAIGLDSVLVYQETYHEENYKDYHLMGKKSHFHYRLNTPDRLGKAEIHKIGIGVLLGLEDWRIDSFFCALHLNYLRKKYWKTQISISFPRIQPADGVKINANHISNKELAQLIFAYRIFDEDVELSLSTRETASFRNNIIPLGITHISAGSKTNPGGYSCQESSLEQFEISDERSPQEIIKMLEAKELDPILKNWDKTVNPIQV